MDDTERIKQQVDRWGTLPSGEYESFEIRLVRAMLNLSACTADQKRVIEGMQPIRPLDSYPDPYAYIEDL